MIEGERHDLIDGHDLAVAEGRGEEAAEIVERRPRSLRRPRSRSRTRMGRSAATPRCPAELIHEHLNLDASLGTVAAVERRR